MHKITFSHAFRLFERDVNFQQTHDDTRKPRYRRHEFVYLPDDHCQVEYRYRSVQ